MHPTLFEFGPLGIHSFGVMVVIAFSAGLYVATKQARRENIPSDIVFNLSICLLISAMAGARIYYVVQHIHECTRFWDVFEVWKGGLTLYGGLALALAVGIIYIRMKGLKVGEVANLLAPSFAIALGFGRIGCFLAGCCYGKETNLPWGISFPADSYAWQEVGRFHYSNPAQFCIHPTQLYASLAGFTIFFILLLLRKRMKKPWLLFLSFLFLYSIDRFLVDFARHYGAGGRITAFSNMPTSQLISILVFAISAALIFYLSRRPHRAEKKENSR